MKTILNRLKTALSTSATLSYVKKFEIVSPKLLPDVSSSMVPYIGIAPASTTESWVSQRKQAVHSVDIYAVIYLQIQESAIIGDSVKKGIIEIVDDIESVVRGHRLPEASVNYLAKPIEISSVDYIVSSYGDNIYLLIASINLQCIRLFDITLP